MEANGPSAATAAVAARVRELRGRRQWSAQRLVDELQKTGVVWNRGVVAKLETGRRESVSVAELLGLAEVFEVTPMALMTGDDADAELIEARALLNEAGLTFAANYGNDLFLDRLEDSRLLPEDQMNAIKVVRTATETRMAAEFRGEGARIGERAERIIRRSKQGIDDEEGDAEE